MILAAFKCGQTIGASILQVPIDAAEKFDSELIFKAVAGNAIAFYFAVAMPNCLATHSNKNS